MYSFLLRAFSVQEARPLTLMSDESFFSATLKNFSRPPTHFVIAIFKISFHCFALNCLTDTWVLCYNCEEKRRAKCPTARANMKKGFVLLMFWMTPRCQGWTTVSGTAFPSCLDYLPRSQEFIDALITFLCYYGERGVFVVLWVMSKRLPC